MRKLEKKSRKYAKKLRRSLTNAEVILWSRLRKKQLNGYVFRRQHPIGPFIADFACIAEKLIIEIDGATHSTVKEIAHDQRRTAFLEDRGWKVLRVTNPDVYENLEGVLEAIASKLPPPSASPPPPPQAGEEIQSFKEDKET
jgi:very-short-patch-repair endonuclease